MQKSKQLSISDLQGLIIKLLPKGHPNINYAADGVGIPVRTLQRRLHHAGYSYTKLVDQARYKTACQLLKNERIPIADIAARLGYHDTSNFSRAFHRWADMSPRAYRKNITKDRS